MKKLLAFILSVVMVLSFTACGGSDSDSKGKSDLEYVKDKGKLVVGITDFAPMDYKEDGKWVGFDADMAKAFAKELGVEVEFVEINWANKALELSGKKIDCVWNGMTLTEEVKETMDCSKPYCKNAQVVVVKKDVADKYQTEESLKDLRFAVEKGSAGESVLKEMGIEYVGLKKQSNALLEVKSGKSDAAVIDLLMAGAMLGDDKGFAELTYTIELNSEEYGVGFRKGSNLVEEFNNFMKKAYEDGSMMECAEKYGVQESIVEQK